MLTTLSQVEGQIQIQNDRNSKLVLNIRISGFRFVSDFEFGASDFQAIQFMKFFLMLLNS